MATNNNQTDNIPSPSPINIEDQETLNVSVNNVTDTNNINTKIKKVE